MWYKCSGEKKIVKFIVAKDIEAEQTKASEMQINRVGDYGVIVHFFYIYI